MFIRTMTTAVAATLFAYSGAQAQLITVDGDTTGGPTFNRATSGNFGEAALFAELSAAGTNVPYQTIPFSVSDAGNVRLETVAIAGQFDTTLFVYSAFDPLNPLVNGVTGDDDGGAGLLSLVNSDLGPGNYVAVVTGFFNTSIGIFRLEIEGPVLVAVVEMGAAGDAGIMATEVAAMLTAAQTQGLRNIVRANHGARQAAGGGSMVQTMNGLSTAEFSVWAEIGGGQFNGDFGANLDASYFFGRAGIEAALSQNLAVGLDFGGAHTSSEVGISSIDGDALFAQPYVAYTADGLTAIASFVYTHTNYDDSLNVIDDGNRYAGSLFVGYDVPIDADTLATPFGFVSGGVEQFDTITGTENADFVTARLGVELSRKFELLNTGSMNTFVSAAAEYVANSDPELGAQALLIGYDDDRIGARVELGFDFTIAGTSTQFFASANGSGLFTDATGFGGNAGIKIPF